MPIPAKECADGCGSGDAYTTLLQLSQRERTSLKPLENPARGILVSLGSICGVAHAHNRELRVRHLLYAHAPGRKDTCGIEHALSVGATVA